MQFIEFKKIFKEQIIFSGIDIEKQIINFNNINLINWQRKGYILKLRNNLYSFTDIDIIKNILFYFANKIYRPSYISLETALSYYGYIPEGVFSIISISTLKTNNFNNKLGVFVYKSIKNSSFFGYTIIDIQNNKFSIAEPEKAILDYLYINHNIKSEDDFEASRLNKYKIKESIDFDKMYNYTELFESKVLIKKFKKFKKYINA